MTNSLVRRSQRCKECGIVPQYVLRKGRVKWEILHTKKCASHPKNQAQAEETTG